MTAPALPPHTLSVAPMMDWTDRHCRVFHRGLTRRTLLYTEMVTTGAILHGDKNRHLDFSAAEHPLALQLGGSDPAALAECARMAEDWGYDEVNLNCGCPSDRVSSGHFGACLMGTPDTVARAVEAGGHGHGHAGMPGMATPAELEQLSAARGQEADLLFLELMTRHHEGALEMAAAHGAEGSDVQALEMSTEMHVEQTVEIERMADLRERVGR